MRVWIYKNIFQQILMSNEILEGIRERDKSFYNLKKQRAANNLKKTVFW